MKLIAFNNQLAVLPNESDQDSSGQGEETEEMDQDQNSDEEGSGETDSEETDSEEAGDSSGEGSEETEEGETEEGETEEGETGEGETGEGETDSDETGDGSESSESETEGSEAEENAGAPESNDREDYDDYGQESEDGEVMDLRDEGDAETPQEAGGIDGVDLEDLENQKALAEMLETLMDQLDEAEEEDTDLKGHNESFTEHFDSLGDEGDLLENENYWRPYFPDKDTVGFARNGSINVVRRYQKAVRGPIAAITTKLRSKFLMARSKKVVHGTRAGTLSERRLVSSMVEIKSGRRATRPNFQEQKKQDCTLAVSLVIDQSGSMNGQNQVYASMGALAIAEPLDKLGAPVMVCGPRNGRYIYGTPEDDQEIRSTTGYGKRDKYHRNHGVHIDVFKDWSEPMNRCLPRFASVLAQGGTPLSDGIQYAMQELSDRTEVHRVIIVLTDGAANCPRVVNRQIRLAKEAGIHVIGVGIGSHCVSVEYQFPENNIQIPDVTELPKKLLSILDGIMFPKKAKKARMDGRIG